MLLTIGIPNFNYGRYLKKAVDSALATNRQDIEVIVADNCSTDDSRQVLESYSDSRLRCHFHSHNIGMYANWNFLLNEACGKYFKLLQSDDWLEPNFFEVFFAELDKYTESDFFLLGSNNYIGDREVPAHSSLPLNYGLGYPYLLKASSSLGISAMHYSMPTLNVVRSKRMKDGGGYHPENHMRSDSIGIAKALASEENCVVTPINHHCVGTFVHGANDRRNYVAFEAYRDEVIFLRALGQVIFADGNNLVQQKIDSARAGCTLHLFFDLRKKKGRRLWQRFLREMIQFKLFIFNPILLCKVFLQTYRKAKP